MKYLGTREKKKLELLEAEIRDEEHMFGDSMTDAERQRLALKKKQLEYAKEHQRLEANVKVDGYAIPEQYVQEKEGKWDHERQMSVLKKRYNDTPADEHAPNSEQRQWEDDQIKSAIVASG